MPRVLVVTANSTLPPLGLAAEVRTIRESLGDDTNFVVVHESETRPADLIRRLQANPPDILHCAGHGLSDGVALILSLDNDQPAIVTHDDLAAILSNVAAPPRVLFMNSCYAGELAERAAAAVDVVVGSTQAIRDASAREFAAAFYSALGTSCSVQSAFKLASAEMRMLQRDAADFELFCRPGVDADSIVFYARPEMLARFEVDEAGVPRTVGNNVYCFELWMRGVDQNAESVTYQPCHKSFYKRPFWEVPRSEHFQFATTLRSYGDVTIRTTAWARGRGQGVETTLSAAVRRHYGSTLSEVISAALHDVESK